ITLVPDGRESGGSDGRIDAVGGIVPGLDLIVCDKGALGLAASPVYKTEYQLGGIADAADVPRICGGLNAEDGADLFGILLQGLPPGEGLLCQAVLFDQDAVANGEPLRSVGDEDEGHFVGEIGAELGGGGEDDAGGVVAVPADIAGTREDAVDAL